MHPKYLKWLGLGPSLPELITQIRHYLQLSAHGICVIRDVPVDDDNVALLSLAHAFGGTPLRDTRMPSRAMEADCVIYRVEEDPLNTDVHAHSATSEHFPLHTDCAHFLHPPEVMMLLCCRPSTTSEHGKTILVHVDEIVDKLAEGDRRELARVQLPWWQGKSIVRAPILAQQHDGNRWLMRFNQATLEREMGREAFARASSLQALIRLLQGVEADPAHTITLEAGDLLIVHNQRVLHGRTAFRSGSARLLKRIRVRVPDL